MDLMDLANTEKKKQSTGSGFLKIGEVVEIMLVRPTHIYDLKKKYDERVQEAKALGEKVPVITYKDLGLAWEGYIIRRDLDILDETKGEYVFDDDGVGNLIFPKWNNKIIIKQYPPHILHTLNNCDIEYGLGGANNAQGKAPAIIDMQPKQKVAQDYKSGVTANNIPERDKEKYQILINVEKKRQEEWKTLKALWLESNEDVRKHYLNDRLSRRFLMCHKEQDEYVYFPPQVGLKFKVGITWVDGYKFSFKAIGPYNKTYKGWDLFSFCDTYTPNSVDIKLADLIVAQAEKKRKQDMAIANNKSKNFEVDDEDEPKF